MGGEHLPGEPRGTSTARVALDRDVLDAEREKGLRPRLGGGQGERGAHLGDPRVLPRHGRPVDHEVVVGDVVGREVAAQRVEHGAPVVPRGSTVGALREHQQISARRGRRRRGSRPRRPGSRPGAGLRRGPTRRRTGGSPGAAHPRRRPVVVPPSRRGTAARRAPPPPPRGGTRRPAGTARASRVPSRSRPPPGTWPANQSTGPGSSQVRTATPNPVSQSATQATGVGTSGPPAPAGDGQPQQERQADPGQEGGA